MGKRYPMKGRKRKQKERYDVNIEEDDEQVQKQLTAEPGEQTEETAEETDQKKIQEEAVDNAADFLEGIPIVPTQKRSGEDSGVIFVLENAPLEVAKVGKRYEILCSEHHQNFLQKNGRKSADYRPDIVHEALKAILDSPLNRTRKVRAVYVKTHKGALFEVKPHTRIPRMYGRFSGLMLQLLQNLSIKASGTGEKLLRLMKNPVTQYFPVNSRTIGFSYSSPVLVDNLKDYVASIGDDTTLVFVVGAMAHGKITSDYTDDFISICDHPLSSAVCINRICGAMESHFKVHVTEPKAINQRNQ